MDSNLPIIPRRTSLVAQTGTVLREQIEGGRWHELLPGEHELCGQLHVSRVTLRAALKQLEREGWVQASQGKRRALTANRAGRHREPATRQVLLLTPEPLESLPTFAVFWVDGLRAQLGEAGFQLEVRVIRGAYGSRSDKSLEALRATARPAVWILYRSTYEMQRWFSAHKLPGVIMGSRHPGIGLPSLDRDYRATCRHAAGQFLASGRRHLVLLNPESGTGGELESEQGFNEAVAQTGVSGVTASVVRHQGTVEEICHRLDALFRKPSPPTALLVSRPVHVLTVLGHLMRRGTRLPQDVALISRDDDAFLEHVVPSVARYASNPSAFAQKLAKLVLEVAAVGGLTPLDYRIMPHFVRGETFP